jgi:hypothetical protein
MMTVGLLMSVCACSSSSNDPGGSDCVSRCEQKASACSISNAADACKAVCDNNPTPAQVNCLAGASCDDIRSGAAVKKCS